MKRRFTLVTLLVIVIVVVIAVFTVNQKFVELKASELNLLIIYPKNMEHRTAWNTIKLQIVKGKMPKFLETEFPLSLSCPGEVLCQVLGFTISKKYIEFQFVKI